MVLVLLFNLFEKRNNKYNRLNNHFVKIQFDICFKANVDEPFI